MVLKLGDGGPTSGVLAEHPEWAGRVSLCLIVMHECLHKHMVPLVSSCKACIPKPASSPGDDVLGTGRDLIPCFIIKPKRGVQRPLENLHAGCAQGVISRSDDMPQITPQIIHLLLIDSIEGWVASERDEKDNTKGPDVTLLPVAFTLEDLMAT